MRSNWKVVKLLFIDEVSFLSSNDIKKLDKHLRLLTGNKSMLYGGLHIVFVGDFFQLNPVGGEPVYSHQSYIYWKQAINACVFLDGSHRFSEDKE